MNNSGDKFVKNLFITDIMKCLFSLLFFICSYFSYAQLDSIHYLQPLGMHDYTHAPDTEYVYLSTNSKDDIEVKVTFPDELTIPRMVVKYGNSSSNLVVTNGIIKFNNQTPVRLYFSNVGSTALTFGNTPILRKIEDLGKVLSSNKVGLLFKSKKLFYVNYRSKNLSQAGSMLSKGLVSKGKNFLWGGTPIENTTNTTIYSNIVSFMAIEDNTIINLKGYDKGIVFYLNGVKKTADSELIITLNKGESYILLAPGEGSIVQNDGWLGSKITSDKDIMVTVGAMLLQGYVDTSGDIAFDQIIPIEKLGNEHILMIGNGAVEYENAIVVAVEPNTKIYLNDKIKDYNFDFNDPEYVLPSANYTLQNIGDYVIIKGNVGYKNGVMRILSDKNVYVYQKVYGLDFRATPSFMFIPPISCNGQNVIDLIPDASLIGDVRYTSSKLSILAKKGESFIPQVKSDNNNVPLTSGPKNVTGNSNWVAYVYDVNTATTGGNLKITSTGTVQAQILGANGAAGFGGYYSGFGDVPKLPSFVENVRFGNVCTGDTGRSVISPKVDLVNGSKIEWFKNDVLIKNANSGVYTIPETDTEPAEYKMVVTYADGCSYYSESVLTTKCPCTKVPSVVGGKIFGGNVVISTSKKTDTNIPNSVNNSFITLKSNDKGMVMTRISNPETEIKSPELGMIVYDTTVNCFKLYNGKEWKCLRQKCYDYDN